MFLYPFSLKFYKLNFYLEEWLFYWNSNKHKNRLLKYSLLKINKKGILRTIDTFHCFLNDNINDIQFVFYVEMHTSGLFLLS